MILYFLIFTLTFCLALVSIQRQPSYVDGVYDSRIYLDWLFIIFLFSIFVGLREKVGGDWDIYLEHHFEASNGDLLGTIQKFGDPGYYLLDWIFANLGASIHIVNFICAIIFISGLSFFCRTLPRPLLGLAVAIPYLIIVVGMGYTRQSVAIGFAMIAITNLINQKTFKFILFVFFAMLFHKSAIIFLVLGLISRSGNTLITFFGMLLLGIIGFYLFLDSYIDQLYQNYILAESNSAGAFVRLLMNFFPAVIFLILRKSMNLPEIEYGLYTWMSWASVALFILFFLTNASTALDRVALYMIPLQLAVFSRIPSLNGSDIFSKSISFLLIIFFYLVVMMVWLNFANHADLWIPYDNILFKILT